MPIPISRHRIQELCRMAMICFVALVGLPGIVSLGAQEFDERFDDWPLHTFIRGTIVVINDVKATSVVDRYLLGSKPERTEVVIWSEKPLSAQEQSVFKKRFSGAGLRFQSTSESKLLEKKKGQEIQRKVIYVNFPAGRNGLPKNFPVRLLGLSLHAGGVIAVENSAARMLSRHVILRSGSEGDRKQVSVGEGSNLFPDGILETEYETNADRIRLRSLVAAHPRSVGVGINKNTSLILRGRKCFVVGSGSATFSIDADARKPRREQTIGGVKSRRESMGQIVDLTEWRRDAIDRTLEAFPAARPRDPHVENGTLVIVGGGGMPRNLMNRFVELSGGKEKAKLVYVPCAEQEQVSTRQRIVAMWEQMGVKSAAYIHTKDRNQANKDQAFLKPLKDATGIWFGGGRQWNFADSYYGTNAHRMMKEVLHRGGVIGGSSAGASIQARYLARATPIGNFRIMAPGYERGGLGFISGVAIDQHFTQRGRQKDMTQLMLAHPQLLGIGIDEATAIIVQKSTATVVGQGKVHFYDRKKPVYPDRPDYIALPAGSVFDLQQRKTLVDTSLLPEKKKDEPAVDSSKAKGGSKKAIDKEQQGK